MSRAEAKLYLSKAQQFLTEARAAHEAARNDVLLNAIHAAISASDAVTTALSGLRSTDPDHQRVTDLLEEVSGKSDEIKTRVRQVRQLLAKKNVVEYESRRATSREATEAVQRSARIVEWAEEIVRSAKL